MSNEQTPNAQTSTPPSKSQQAYNRVVTHAPDYTIAGAVVTLLLVYHLIPAEASPPLNVILGALFGYAREYLRPTERREI